MLRLGKSENRLLLADQVVCSGSNAAAVMLASFFLATESLNQYVVLQLIGTTAIGLQRALFLDPSLVVSRNIGSGISYGRWLTFVYVPSGLGVVVGVLFDILPLEALLVFLLIAAPLLQDCLRYKAFVAKSFGWPLVSDLIWLVFLVCGTLGWKPRDVLLMFALWGGGAIVAVIPLVHVRQSLSGRQFRQVLRLGKYQFAEWSLAAFTTTVPLFVMQAAIPLASISAFRLAQTLMGPLNTVTSFVSVKYLLDSASFSQLDRRAVRQRVSRTSWILVGLASSYGSLVVVTLLLFGQFVDPVLAKQLIYAVPVTVIAAIVTSPCTPYLALARSLSLHRATIMPRLLVVFANVLAIGMGIVLWGELRLDPLVVTSLFTAIISYLIYRRLFMKVLIDRPLKISITS